jgi:hypothetical protein
MKKKILPQNDPKLAISMNNLATVYISQNKFKDA